MKGKAVLITGSTGIARATAALAVQAGAQVTVTSRTPEHGEELSRSLGCRFLRADLAQPGEAEGVVGQVGQIDALFNVAGISGRKFGDGPVHECSPEGWDVTLSTNAKSMFLMCKAALGRMMAQPVAANGLRGTILNMASVLGFAPQAQHFATHAYAASKGAILGMSRSMAAYYAPLKIRVNVIAPALVRTPMSLRAQGDPEILELMKRKQPLAQDLIEAEEVARAALFLLGDDSRRITGDTLVVDAGWSVS